MFPAQEGRAPGACHTPAQAAGTQGAHFKLSLCLSLPCCHFVPLPQPAQVGLRPPGSRILTVLEVQAPYFMAPILSSLSCSLLSPTSPATTHHAKESRLLTFSGLQAGFPPNSPILPTTGEWNIPASYPPSSLLGGHPCAGNPHFLLPGPLRLRVQPYSQTQGREKNCFIPREVARGGILK